MSKVGVLDIMLVLALFIIILGGVTIWILMPDRECDNGILYDVIKSKTYETVVPVIREGKTVECRTPRVTETE